MRTYHSDPSSHGGRRKVLSELGSDNTTVTMRPSYLSPDYTETGLLFATRHSCGSEKSIRNCKAVQWALIDQSTMKNNRTQMTATNGLEKSPFPGGFESYHLTHHSPYLLTYVLAL